MEKRGREKQRKDKIRQGIQKLKDLLPPELKGIDGQKEVDFAFSFELPFYSISAWHAWEELFLALRSWNLENTANSKSRLTRSKSETPSTSS